MIVRAEAKKQQLECEETDNIAPEFRQDDSIFCHFRETTKKTRSQKRKYSLINTQRPEEQESELYRKDHLIQDQEKDETLKQVWQEWKGVFDKFVKEEIILYRLYKDKIGSTTKGLVVPQSKESSFSS